MRIVYVLKRFPKFSETFVLREIGELLRQGENVTVLSLERPHGGEPLHEGVDEVLLHTRYLPAGSRRAFLLGGAALASLVAAPAWSWPALAWCVRWAVTDRRPHHFRRFGEAAYLRNRLPPETEHIHAHFAHGPATVALLLSRARDVPYSFTAHARDLFELTRDDLLAAKVHEARFVVVVSEYTRRYVAQRVAPDDGTKVVVVRNGVEVGGVVRTHGPEEEPLILSVSRLVEKKGLDTLIEACRLLLDRGVAFRCEVVGSGPLRGALVDRAAALRLDGRLRIDGALQQRDVRDLYGRASAFVLPSRVTSRGDRDTLPVAIVEALAAGVPVVTTPVAGIPEVIRDEETGLLVPPDDAASLADALERVLTDADLRSRLGDGAREVARRFELSTTVSELRALFAARGPA